MASAPPEFAYVEEKLFVWTRFSGLWPIANLEERPPLILAECQARKQDLLLIDFMNIGNKSLSLAERFRLGMSILKFAGRLRKVACAAPPRLIDKEKFGERVARNRGVNLRVFPDLEQARTWLLAEE